MNESEFKAVLAELIEENPLAVRAVLKIVDVEFTDRVGTLAVTVEARPRLLVNLGFVSEHCKTEAHVKTVICHEFLHVLLRHTDRVELLTQADHLAFDAVINAIIHRTLGRRYSDFMAVFSARERWPYALLRPYDFGSCPDRDDPHRHLYDIWYSLYVGKLCADDIRDIVTDLQSSLSGGPVRVYLGDHSDRPNSGAAAGADPFTVSPAMAEALDRSLKAMNGSGIWRKPKKGVGATAYQSMVTADNAGVERWRRATYRVLRRYLLPDVLSPKEPVGEAVSRLPVLNAADRRGFARALWSPLLPDIVWTSEKHARVGRAQVYLDVSGSMNAEMPLIVALLARLSRYIKRPFWAFSDKVAPAVIRDGQLVADTTGGTSMTCVLEHVARTKPRAAIVVTDGYIEPVDPQSMANCGATRLHAVVTRDGDPAQLHEAGIPYTQLGRLP